MLFHGYRTVKMKNNSVEKMRTIFLVVNSMHTGGAERVAAHLANAWTMRGDSVVIIATFSGRGECHYELDSRVRLIYLADLVARSARFSFWQRRHALRDLICSMKPQVIVSFLTNVNVMTLVAAAGLNVPVIVSERSNPEGYDPGLALKILRKFTYKRASAVVMLAEVGLQWLSKNIPGAKGIVIPNPVSYPLVPTEPLRDIIGFVKPGRKLILGAGRLSDQKQFDKLILAFGEVASRYVEWDLVIAGEGPDRIKLERLVADLALQDRVILPGRIGNIGDWYAAADIYVMSSRVEGFPNTLAEAMAHGCAAVSYDCDTGPRDIINDGVNGLLVVPVGDVPKLAGSMERLMRDTRLRELIREQATGVRKTFSVSAIIEQWEQLFQDVAPRSR